jgi:hypothetical protein
MAPLFLLKEIKVIDFSKLWSDYALYLPAYNDGYAKFCAEPSANHKARLPGKLKPSDLNPLDPTSKLVRWPNALYTAAYGTRDTKDTVISRRKRGGEFILGDSGGYSVISGAIDASRASFRKKVLEWQERDCDVGVILDVPTRALDNPKSGIVSFDDCLKFTIENLKFARDHRSNSALRLLNVMQGRTTAEAMRWYESVVQFQMEGLAIGGHTRLNMWFWIGRFLDMIERGLFDSITHIHFLGTAQPSFAVMATALQRALRKYVRPNITVSFDSSLAFRIAQGYGQISTGLRFGDDQLKLTSHILPNRGGEVQRTAAFPFSSPLGDLCTVGDFFPNTDPYGPAADGVGMQMISSHAMSVELLSLLQANRLADMKQQANSALPYTLRKAVEAIEEVFRSSQQGKVLDGNKAPLSAFGLVADDDRIGWA